MNMSNTLNRWMDNLQVADGIAPLALRLYLAPVMLQSGWNKYIGFDGVTSWFEHSLELPFPVLMAVQKARAISILKEHSNYRWLTSSGPITILNNGIEFAITYFLMLLSLFFTGGGRYTSLDHWIKKRVSQASA